MQIGTRFATPTHKDTVGQRQPYQHNQYQSSYRSSAKAAPREARLDLVSAAVVVGLTAQFVTFIFGLVTEFVPRWLDNILLSVFIGMSVGVIAFALMKENQ